MFDIFQTYKKYFKNNSSIESLLKHDIIDKYINDKYIKEKIKKHFKMEPLEDDIEIFYIPGTRSTNDEINKKREKIIELLGNKMIDNEWIKNNPKWSNLNEELKNIINNLKPPNTTNYVLMVKGGRKKNYDILLTFYQDNVKIKEVKIEFKYGVNEINECPQWVSPHDPSQYFDKSYQELFYEEYLPKLSEKYSIDIPPKELYLKQINGNKPQCMDNFLLKYYKGSKKSSKYTGEKEDIDNYNYAKKLNNESIKQFLENSNLNVDVLNEYFLNTQKDKIYLLWNNSKFNVREKDVNDYQINKDKKIIIKNNNCLCGETKSGITINILMRWKNGVAYPALQIS